MDRMDIQDGGDDEPLLGPSHVHNHRYDEEESTLSPLTKCLRFGRFPFKLVVHILLCVLITTRISLEANELGPYSAQQIRVFRNLFTPSGDSEIFTIEEMRNNLNTSINNYCSFVNSSVGTYTIPNPDCSVQLTVTTYTGHHDPFHPSNDQTAVTIYTISPAAPYGPLSQMPSRDFMNTLASMEIRFVFNGVHIGSHGFWLVQWTCANYFDTSPGGGAIKNKLTIYRDTNNGAGSLIALDVVILILAIWSLILTSMAIWRSLRVFLHVRARLISKQTTQPGKTGSVWANVSYSDRYAFFNSWNMSQLVGDICLIASSVSALPFAQVVNLDLDDSSNITRAIAVFLSWVNLIRYLQWSTSFYVLVLAVSSSLSRTLKFFITSLPLFVGYALAGVVLFSTFASDLFGNIDLSAVTLFAVLNGDSILGVFEALNQADQLSYRVVGRIYLYTFSAFFITVVLNVFIFIIADGYDAARTMELNTCNNEEDDHDRELKLDVDRVRDLLNLAKEAETPATTAVFEESSEVAGLTQAEIHTHMNDVCENSKIRTAKEHQPSTSSRVMYRSISSTSSTSVNATASQPQHQQHGHLLPPPSSHVFSGRRRAHSDAKEVKHEVTNAQLQLELTQVRQELSQLMQMVQLLASKYA